jgi:hypothetical protein
MAMGRRSPFIRFLTLFLATLQIASPGVSAIADGRLSLENASGPATHIESKTTASCPVVHHPDCGVCRYLSAPSAPAKQAAFGSRLSALGVVPRAEMRAPRTACRAAPNGRAPPTV